jgi:hypothetical protein
MGNSKYFIVTLFLCLLLVNTNCLACSMYKITYSGKTMVGCNEDNWRLTSTIWFETKDTHHAYGAAFTGSRIDGANGVAPQSGMNDQGLVFSRLASPTPTTGIKNFTNRKIITNPTQYLKDILHNCKNIEDVKAFISVYDPSYFLQDVFIYIEKSGRYLVVEPYTFVEGSDAKYVLSNFCPSVTTPQYASKLERYNKGTLFLKNKLDSTLAFATALSDTMHVCRNKIGDGTLLTSIWDANNQVVSLYFYHNYKNKITFNISNELAKGNHQLEIPKLFPHNNEYEQLKNYKIPKNNMPIAICLLACLGLFLITILYFIIQFFTSKNQITHHKIAIVLLVSILIYYLYVLLTNINIYYFPSPYKDHKFTHLNIAAYIPFLLLLCIVPMLFFTYNEVRWHKSSVITKSIFVLNSCAFILLLCLFGYWRLFGI